MRKKTHKQPRKSLAETSLKTKTRDIELTEKELGKVTGGQGCATGQHFARLGYSFDSMAVLEA